MLTPPLHPYRTTYGRQSGGGLQQNDDLATAGGSGGTLNFANTRAEHLAVGLALLAIGCLMSHPWVRLCARRRAAATAQKSVDRADRWRSRPEERRRLVGETKEMTCR